MARQGWERGLGHYSERKNPEQHRSATVDNSGNPKEKARELDKEKLDHAAATGKGLPKNAR